MEKKIDWTNKGYQIIVINLGCKTTLISVLMVLFVIKEWLSLLIKGVGLGVQGQKSWKHNLEITGDPKGPPNWVLRSHTHMGSPFLRLNRTQKSKMAIKDQNQNYS